MNPGGRAVGGLAASHRRCYRHIRVWAAGCVLVGEGLGDRGGGGLAGVGVGAGDVVADGHVLDGWSEWFFSDSGDPVFWWRDRMGLCRE